MIALDTNVLVRIAVADDPGQTEQAVRLLERARASGERLFVPDIVLCELAWVLRASYGLDRAGVVTAISALTEVDELIFRDPDAVGDAIAAHARGDGGFADHLIAATARAAGCEAVATFDQALQKLPGFVAP
ncbi:MAG: type II toxin-antitoxin system VapC family toxin [Anaeromyxobacteraceae bacterium]